MNKERALLITLALIQFTHVMDFMVMMPLSTMFMRDFQISAASFGLVVASYNISAGVVSVAVQAGDIILQSVRSTIKEHHWMEESAHPILIDNELDEVTKLS